MGRATAPGFHPGLGETGGTFADILRGCAFSLLPAIGLEWSIEERGGESREFLGICLVFICANFARIYRG